jgi:glycosyltransferase involved in cell wall biosynthesis
VTSALQSPASRSAVLEPAPATGSGPQVLQVVLELSPGGTERLVIELSERLHATHGMHVCCLDAPGAWAAELIGRGISVTSLGRGPGFSPALGRQIARIAATHKATVLHCHQYSPFVYGTLARLWRPMGMVFTEHGRASDAPPSLKRRVANGLLARFPARVLSVSNDLRNHLTAEGFPAPAVRVIYNGIRIGAAPGHVARREARSRLGLGPQELVIGAVGRLDPVKDLGTLLKAFREVRRSLPHARLVMVGDGPERAALADRIRAAGLVDSVIMTGYRSDVAALLPAFDIYVNSSIFEGVSLTILEAMAAAVPVVATSVGGTPEVVVDGETGRLVPARDAGALAGALRAVATSTETAKRLAANGRGRVERHFSIEHMVDQYATVYRSLEGR